MAVPAQRDYICQGIYRAIQMNDDMIMQDAMQSLAELPEIAYQHLGDQIKKIGEITHNLLQTRQRDPVVGIFEFWINLAVVEKTHIDKN